jgi:segregation and condensation protein B
VTEELTTAELAQAAQAEEAKELEVPTPERVEEAGDPVAESSGEASEVSAEPDAPHEAVHAEPPEPVDGLPVESAEAEPREPEDAQPHESEDAQPQETAEVQPLEPVDAEQLVITVDAVDTERTRFKAIIEAVIYITDEPLSAQQIAGALGRPIEEINSILEELTNDYAQPDRGLSIREVAGGYKMGTKPEHHEEIRAFVKNLKPPLKLSLAALETLAVIAYKQPITAPEIMEIRGVQGAGVLKTLLDRKVIATAGRKNVIGKPILYKTTKEFLVQFGLKDLAELPTLKEFEELGRLALTDADSEPGTTVAPPAAPAVHEPGHTPAEFAQDPESAPVEAPGAVELVENGQEPEPEPPVREPDPGEPPIEEPPPPPDAQQSPEKTEPGETNG